MSPVVPSGVESWCFPFCRKYIFISPCLPLRLFKTFKRTVEINEFKAVLVELKIMAYMGDYEFILKFIGAEISEIAKRRACWVCWIIAMQCSYILNGHLWWRWLVAGKLMIVTELSPNGDLLQCLCKVASEGTLQGSASVKTPMRSGPRLLSQFLPFLRGCFFLKRQKATTESIFYSNLWSRLWTLRYVSGARPWPVKATGRPHQPAGHPRVGPERSCLQFGSSLLAISFSSRLSKMGYSHHLFIRVSTERLIAAYSL